jgi:D-glycero-alpha-D-manno-heptose 1-phosphate guanylyltransferase
MPTVNPIEKSPVFVLVGGLGTRLRTAYTEGPKALAPIAGAPFLSYLLRQLKSAGFRSVNLCVGYGHEQIEKWMGSYGDTDLVVRYSVEEEPLGTAGAIRLASERYPVEDSFVVMNGDSMLQVDFEAMLQFHRSRSVLGTAALAWVQDTGRYGSVELDDANRIVAFREKTDRHDSSYINGGIYIFQPPVLDLIPSPGASSLERDILPALCPANFCGFKTDGYFLDIGVP